MQYFETFFNVSIVFKYGQIEQIQFECMFNAIKKVMNKWHIINIAYKIK